jgi:hypothetical protein
MKTPRPSWPDTHIGEMNSRAAMGRCSRTTVS